MEYIKIKDILEFKKKSKIKASEGLKIGKYNFYTSSKEQNKFLDYYEYSNEALIIGTGGNANIHHSYGKFSVSTDCFVLENKANKFFLLEYIYKYLLKNIHIIENGFRGAGLKHISKEYLENIEIPIISLEKQKKLIKNLKNIDTFIDKNKQIKNELNFLNKSLFTRMFGDILSNSFNWEQVKLQDICSSIVRGPFGSSLKKEFFVKNGYKVYEQKNAINQSADLGEYYIDEKKFKELQRFECKTGDIIMSCSGTVGKLFQLPKNSKTGIINQALCKFSLNNKIISIYFLKYLEKVMENLKLNGSGIKNISSVSYIKKIDINLPPIELQNKFAERVEKIEKLSFEIEKSIKEAENLYNSLMNKYFD